MNSRLVFDPRPYARALAALLFVTSLSSLALGAEEPDTHGAPSALRFGGDASGGAPYIFDAPDGGLTGFEVELATVLAKRLGRANVFVNGDWGRLPYLLDRGTIDVVLNGYEWSAEREAKWASTIPYYVYELQLVARAADGTLTSWDDLRTTKDGARRKVGVLAGSAAERYLTALGGVEVLPYPDVVRTLQLVRDGQLDATLQDVPAAVYYAREFPELRDVGAPVAPGYYVMFVKKEDRALRAELDDAIRALLGDGTLEAIYARYGLWSTAQAELRKTAEHWPPETSATASTEAPVGLYARALGRAAGMTVALSVLAMPLAMVLGLFIAVGRLYGPRWLDRPLLTWVELVRGTPVLFQLYVIYYLLPAAGVRIPEFWAGVIGLGLNYSAYEAENYRAGLLAVSSGQLEAALALGMSKVEALRRVVVPQAWRVALPPVTGDFISLFKDTSVCSVIAVTELSNTYNRLSNDHPIAGVELGLITAVLYLSMSYPLSMLTRAMERRFVRVEA